MFKELQFGTRHVQCFMVFLCVAASFLIRVHLSVAIVSMTTRSSLNDAPVLEWDSRMKGTVMSSFYWGYIFILIPAGRVAEKFGPKISLVSAMFICGVVMVITPFAAVFGGFYWMIVTRILIGATQAFLFPAVNVMLSNWAPTGEKGMLFSFVLSGQDFGTVVTMTMAGALVDSRWGWPSVFYVCGTMTILWALLYAYVGANSPQDHKKISEHEKSFILSSLPNNSQEKDNLKTPWRAIFTSIPLYAIIVAHCTTSWGFHTILFLAPSYINAVLGLSMKDSGLLSALPYLSSLIAGNVYAVMNFWFNKKKVLSRTALLKLWNSYSLWGSALALCLLAFAGKNKTLVVTLLIIAVTINVAYHAGYHSNHLDLSPNFAGTLMGITTAISTVSSLGSPLYAGFVVTDPKSVFSWKIVFLTAAVLLFIGNLFFVIFASAEVQPWNFPPNATKLNPEDATSKDEIAKKEKGNSEVFTNEKPQTRK